MHIYIRTRDSTRVWNMSLIRHTCIPRCDYQKKQTGREKGLQEEQVTSDTDPNILLLCLCDSLIALQLKVKTVIDCHAFIRIVSGWGLTYDDRDRSI